MIFKDMKIGLKHERVLNFIHPDANHQCVRVFVISFNAAAFNLTLLQSQVQHLHRSGEGLQHVHTLQDPHRADSGTLPGLLVTGA